MVVTEPESHPFRQFNIAPIESMVLLGFVVFRFGYFMGL
jgi:hypothetical protein